ncbi:HSP20 family protein [Halopelagius inordinatus]|uniref:HSP20 family protein n=1 Tax=Halopelagius inordinatus TaxID=553467 RepID=A0A1I2VEH5_9EURY|nr:Hsp20/alpha crystallin family protein [Halopelagius inordinatus]SFG87483.1 HSP20 family protein [Halopelagius inordinatus]
MMPNKDPFREIERMVEEINRQFEQSPWATGGEEAFGRDSVDVDLADHGDEFVVTADLPGFRKENIDVQCTDDRLTIRADRENETETGEENYIRRERTTEQMRRSVRLPEPVDADGVSATFRNGVLSVTLPKVDSSETGQNIDIE